MARGSRAFRVVTQRGGSGLPGGDRLLSALVLLAGAIFTGAVMWLFLGIR